ncbi:MAG: PIN domain-containing protein [Acidobacteria bacterium]|nr:PIN domain-containing protein [Acidobacteriota bacterium]
MKSAIVILDACVLFPAPLRDFLMHLALLDVFQARWTNEIHAEWIRNVLEMRPDLNEKQLNRTRDLMNTHIRDCLVENYQHLINRITLPDENDRHVLAAAIKSNAEIILTFNLRDFPNDILQTHNLKAIKPDRLLSELFDANAEKFNLAFARQLKSLKNPPKTAVELLQILESQPLEETIEKLRNHRNQVC